MLSCSYSHSSSFKSSVYSTFIGQDTCGVLKVSHVFPLSKQVCQAADLPLVDSPLCSREAPNHKDSGSKMSSRTSLRLLTFFKNREHACSGHHLIPSMCWVHKWCSVRVWSPRGCNLPRYSPLGGQFFPRPWMRGQLAPRFYNLIRMDGMKLPGKAGSQLSLPNSPSENFRVGFSGISGLTVRKWLAPWETCCAPSFHDNQTEE